MNITSAEIDGRILALTAQRNEALDRCVLMQGIKAADEAEKDDLRKQIEALKGRLAKREKKE